MRAAVVQAAPVAFDVDVTLDKVEQLAAEADADLVVFPEAFVSCYPRGYAFGAVRRHAHGRGSRVVPALLGVLHRRAGPGHRAARGDRARARLAPRDRRDRARRGTLYCTALFLAPDGALLGKHRKLMPTASERLVWGFGDGSTLPVFDTPLGRVGAVICWENYMPLLRMAMYARGSSSTRADRGPARTWIASMRHIACEGRCFVLSANQFARRSDYPDDYPVDVPADHVMCRGNSVIVSPLGELLAGPETEGEAILRAEVDIGRTVEGKYDFDVAGHYSRPDIFRLEVNERQLD